MKVLVSSLRRTFLTILGVLTLTFFLARFSGDPVALLISQASTGGEYAAMRAQLGLDQPVIVQYVIYLANIAQGNFGNSITYSRPALEIVAARIPATLELTLPSLILSGLIGFPLGVVSAYRRGSWLDLLTMRLSLALQSLPQFFVGIGLILIFGVHFRWLPTFGRDGFLNLILPIITLTIYPLAIIIRITRNAVLDEIGAPYVRTAHGKGLRPARIIGVHTIPNALIPVITVLGLQVAGILSGAAIIETVFAWPGIGSLSLEAVGGRDYPIIQTVVLLSAAAFVTTNIMVDLLYVLVDPRIRLS